MVIKKKVLYLYCKNNKQKKINNMKNYLKKDGTLEKLKELEEQDIEELIEKLRRYNNWRRGAEIPMPHPQEITEMIDEAIKVLKTTIKK